MQHLIRGTWLVVVLGLVVVATAARGTDGPAASFFDDLFKTYVPRGRCMNNERPLIGVHVIADVLIAASYYSIPVALIYFVRRRRDIAFNGMFIMFALFILACGTTHVFGVWAIWQPLYRLDGVVKMVTAGLSVATAVALWPLIPKALALPSPAQLEGRVRDRTAELDRANAALREQMAAAAEAEAGRARLAAIVESSDDAIIGKALDGTITSWNRGAERLYGYAAAEAVGRSIILIVPADRHDEERAILGRLSGGEAVDHFETVRVTRDGRAIDVSVTVSPIRDAGGRVVGASKIARDITERKRHERERDDLLARERAARGEAERASRTKDEFLATLSHELRTPLNAIYGWSQILGRRELADAELAQGIEVIERNSRLQTQLIDDLLDMSRIVSGKVRLDVAPLDLPRIVRDALGSVGPAAAARNIRVRTVLEPAAGTVTGDAARVQQVAWNLLTNAVKFTPKGGTVDVSLARVNSHVELTVADSGEGIGADLLPHVFERFRQGDSSSTRRHGGLGLGLAIVKYLVELHGGTVRVSSPGLGRGATFVVCLPVRAVDATPPAAGGAPAEGLAGGGGAAAPADGPLPSLGGLRVLVVDDEPDARDLIRRLLEQAGARVTSAGSAAHALELLGPAGDDGRPHVLVSDIGMPDEDGYALIRRVRGMPAADVREIPAVALTAFARSEDRMKSMLAGFQMHLSKPVEPAELITVVASLAGVLGRGRGE